MLFDSLYLNGCTVSYPGTRVPVAEALAQGLVRDFDETIGNPEVPVFEGGAPAADLAVEALKGALKASGTDPSDVGLLLHCSWWHQGFDIWSAAHYVAHRTGALGSLPMNLSQGCNAPMAALELAGRAMLADPSINSAAVTASDAMLAPQVDRWNLNYGCVHGDAGTAMLVSREPAERNSYRIVSLASSAAPELEEMNRSGYEPTPGPAMRAGGTVDLKAAKKDYLTQYGIEGFTGRSRESLTACVREALADAGLTGAEDRIRVVALPRLSGKIFETVYRPLLAPFFGEEKLLWQGGETAHLGVADVGANIADSYERQGLRPGDLCVVVNAGGGYTWSCLVLELVC
ncbi:ketoacyl-ACP synthase III family protein [Streptacidiphilus melanogenes]|uniref:ketoacyl-ACP synthase III family protein n=1 Tax=Streptacidiphilus melanogenes TaxID=411235 RepID=UPI001269D762|nr:ketoacyl-ACP synthase III family protein [Streptacidiphilus melanogenes]